MKSYVFVLIVAAALLLSGCFGSALTKAASEGRTEEVKALLDAGANIHERPQACSGELTALGGAEALSCAAIAGHSETVRLLLERGANVDNTNPQGFTALALAACAGDVETIKVLIEYGADVDHALVRVNSMPGRWMCSSEYPLTLLASLAREHPPKIKKAKTALEKSLLSVKSDVDALPKKSWPANPKAYALVIGIEEYWQKLPSADFATSDAKAVAHYLTKSLGYPEENVVTVLNDQGLKSNFEKYVENWLGDTVVAEATVFVYFSGLGAPDPKTGEAYLIPYDGDPSTVEESGYPLKRLYAALGKLPAKEIIVVLDTCFSGAGGRSVVATGARAITHNLRDIPLPSANMTVLAAATGDQMNSTYDDKGHGLFTYFLLKGIKGGKVVAPDGSLRPADLFAYLKPQVEAVARKEFKNKQTPQLIGANTSR